jgi:hypothetical protein
MKIIVGSSSISGDILVDYNEAKACNFCIHFRGYGLHACAGHCVKLDKDIGGGYIGNYRKVGKDCDYFECRPALLINDEGDNK